MAEGRLYFDASAYMLFEASGDSLETQYHDGALELESDAGEEDDDALSCSYGSVISAGGGAGRVNEADSGGGGNFRGGDNDDRGGSDEEAENDGGCGEEEEEEEDGVVDQCRRRGTAEAEENPVRSNRRDESNVKMSEVEGDRLFWESCLAS